MLNPCDIASLTSHTCFLFKDIEIEKNKEEVLLSKQWGSFFIHPKTTQNGFIDNPLDESEKKTGRKQMNTFLGDVIQKYSTIAIPRIDFITGMCAWYYYRYNNE